MFEPKWEEVRSSLFASGFPTKTLIISHLASSLPRLVFLLISLLLYYLVKITKFLIMPAQGCVI